MCKSHIWDAGTYRTDSVTPSGRVLRLMISGRVVQLYVSSEVLVAGPMIFIFLHFFLVMNVWSEKSVHI